MTLLDTAIQCIGRGWHVFPCWPKTKKPMTAHGWHDATLDEAQVRRWWARTPDANAAIACGPSNLAVLDIDHGIADRADAVLLLAAMALPATYMVRTGRRPEYGLQVYFEGAIPDVGLWKAAGAEGQVKSLGGYVMAAGSVHPSGERYECVDSGMDGRLAPTPAFVRGLKPERVKVEDGPITGNRNVALTSIAGKLRNAGLSADALRVALLQVNADRCAPPMDESEVERIAANAAKWELPSAAGVTLGKAEAETPVNAPLADWRDRYHTLVDLDTIKPARFIVEGILHEDSIVGLAGYAGDRKSIVSLNLAAACVTGKPFMGRFAVTHPPKRVLYCCPEMGLRELAERVRGLDMLPHFGKTLFCRTLDKSGGMRLPDLTEEELDGALVILDTAIRFLEGSENDPQDMARFADELFRLRSAGATVWVLFHSSKASAGQDLTLQNAVRGSSELAAMLSACWATRLTDPTDRFGSHSRMYPMKVREFEALPFEFEVVRETAECKIIGEPAPEVVLKSRKDDDARETLKRIVEAEPDIGINKVRERMKTAGCGRGQKWVALELAQVRGSGVGVRTERPYSETYTL